MAKKRTYLRDEPIDYIEQQFNEKNGVLVSYGEQVSAATLYEDVFGDLEIELPFVLIDEDETKHIQPMTLEKGLVYGKYRNDVLVGGSTYFNNYISKNTTKDIHAFIIDLDNVYSEQLRMALENDWRNANAQTLAKPTYVVNSGTGLHLYFVLSEPIPVYHSQVQDIDSIYRELVRQQARRMYVKTDMLWYGQDFRMAGGLNKYEWENTVFRIGEKWDIEDLAKAVDVEVQIERYGQERKKKSKAERPKVVPNKRKSMWSTNRAFFDYAVKEVRANAHEGCRYMNMCALSVIAYKCSIWHPKKNPHPVSEEELEQTLKSLLPQFNKDANRKIKEREIKSAMKMFNPKAMETPREILEGWQEWEYKPIPRNGRTREQHIKLMNFVRDEINNNREWRNKDGRPKGSGTAQEKVQQFRTQHPDGTKSQCKEMTGLSYPTIRKWWDA